VKQNCATFGIVLRDSHVVAFGNSRMPLACSMRPSKTAKSVRMHPVRHHSRSVAVRAGPPVMVNSCTGKMGHATAEAVLRAGLTLVPYTFCGYSQGVAVGDVGVSGIPVERITPDNRARVRT
jgi:hypothetical protein